MTLAPEITRQYLSAMGIESWEPRIAEAGLAQSAPEQGVASAELLSAVQLDVASFLQSLAGSPVTVTTRQQAGILVLLEAPALSAAGHALLSSMFKAIDMDLSQQSLGYVGDLSMAEPEISGAAAPALSSLAEEVRPSMIVVMVDCHIEIDALATHRAMLHSLSWAQMPLAITLHPEVLLNNPAFKRYAWEDLKRVKAALSG